MMTPNLLYVFVAALIPMVVGMLWYNDKVFGKAWQKAAEMSDEKIKNANMGVIFGMSFVLALVLAYGIALIVGNPNDIMCQWAGADLSTLPEGEHLNFTHGAFHGGLFSLLIALPALATNALFERKGFGYIAINAGYWLVSMALMGGVLAQLG